MCSFITNLYAEFIFREALHDHIGDIRINGVPINNIGYVDDTAILAGVPQGVIHLFFY